MRPAMIQISLRICAVWSESSLGTFSIAKDAKFLHAENEYSDQTVRIHRLTFVGDTCKTSWKHAYIILTPLNPTFI